MTTFMLNDKVAEVNEKDKKITLKILKQNLRQGGTKEGCGEGDCGACMVLVGERLETNIVQYRAINSCLLLLSELEGKQVVTIEGLNQKEPSLIQATFAEEFASQCGFCTPGFIIAVTAFLLNAPSLDRDEAVQSIGGNVCRCTGYISIRKALSSVLKKIGALEFNGTLPCSKGRIDLLVRKNVLPKYFCGVIEKLQAIPKNQARNQAKESVIFGGGTDLAIQKRNAIEEMPLYFISQRKDLGDIVMKGEKCFIGGNVTFEEMRTSALLEKVFPNIKESFKLIASLPIRNRASVAGNIINASPIGDVAIFLLAQNATLVFSKDGNKREVPLRNFFKGYKVTDKEDSEILEWIYFDMPNKNEKVRFEKVSKRKHLDIASVNTAFRIEENSGLIARVAISAGGVGPFPLYLAKTCEFLEGKEVTDEVLKQALIVADSEISPISDIRGSEEYKRLLLRNLIVSHFATLFPEKLNIMAIL